MFALAVLLIIGGVLVAISGPRTADAGATVISRWV
jgi:hypothetical protein